jgi:hypothetical protein
MLVEACGGSRFIHSGCVSAGSGFDAVEIANVLPLSSARYFGAKPAPVNADAAYSELVVSIRLRIIVRHFKSPYMKKGRRTGDLWSL